MTNAPDAPLGEIVDASRRVAKAPGDAASSGNDSAPITGDGGRELPDQGSNLEPSG